MIQWLAALGVAAAIVYALPPRLSKWAFKKGWFERSSETDASRGQRRPTHGGLVVCLAVAAGSLLAIGEDAALPAIGACAAAAAMARFTDRGLPTLPVLVAARGAAALAVPLLGARAELTGSTAIDVVLTAGAVAVVMGGLGSLEKVEGALAAVAGLSGLGLLMLALRVDDPDAPVAAAATGAALAALARSGPPAQLRLVRSGATALGGALAAAAITADPTVIAPRSSVVPLLALAVPAAAVVVPGFAQRLAARGLPAATTLAVVTALCAFEANRVATGAQEPLTGVVVVGAVLLVTAIVALTARLPDAPHFGAWRWAGLGLLVLLGAAGAPAAMAARDARGDMLEGREYAVAGLESARDGDLEAAQASFAQADAAFGRADDALASPAVVVAHLVPGAAQNLRAAQELADVGRQLSGTAVAVAQRAGADDLRVVDGRFPVEAAADVGAQLAAARGTLGSAQSDLDDLQSPWLTDEVESAVVDLTAAVADADESIAFAAEATRLAPRLLGADGLRTWFVAAISSSELRGSGGILGDFALVDAAGGDLTLQRTGAVSELNTATDRAAMAATLPPIYAQAYGGWNADRFWQNLTVTPDFPTVGEAVTGALPVVGVEGVGGVIGIDPIGVAGLLELTGPITVPLWPVPISAENAVSVLTFENYDQLPVDQIDEFQSSVLRGLVDALTTGDLPGPSELASTLAPAVAGGHLRFWSPDADEEALFTTIGADGSAEPEGPYDQLTVITQDSSEAKIDYFLRRAVTYDVDFDPITGESSATATVTLTNLAPDEGVSEYVIGGAPNTPTAAGENRLSLLLRSELPVTEVTDPDGNVIGLFSYDEAGLRMTGIRTVIPPGGSQTFVFHLEGRLPPGPTYRLNLGRQPAAYPDEVTVTFGSQSSSISLDAPHPIELGVG